MTTTAAQDEFNELLRDKDTSRHHPEDRAHASDHSDAESSHPADYLERTDTDDELDLPADMRSNYYLPSIKSEANTGPKGVIADAHAFEQAKKQARRSLWRKTTPPNSYSVAAYHDEKSDEDDGEDSFMKKWRESRLRDLQNAGQRIRSRTTSPSRKIYGNLPTVDALGYLDAIEKVSRDTVVVVFIYDDASDISTLCESYMREIAQRNNTTRFVRLHYEEAEMEGAGVPAVLAYKNSELLVSMVPLIDALPDDSELSIISLETLFRRHQII